MYHGESRTHGGGNEPLSRPGFTHSEKMYHRYLGELDQKKGDEVASNLPEIAGLQWESDCVW